jgi:hypothetical protein
MAAKKKNSGARDLTTEVLVQIRDEMRHMREDLRRLEKRQGEDSTRLAAELVAVAKAVIQVRDLLRDQRVDRERVDDHEKRIRSIGKIA